jgi:hypothetical protein
VFLAFIQLRYVEDGGGMNIAWKTTRQDGENDFLTLELVRILHNKEEKIYRNDHQRKFPCKQLNTAINTTI